MKKLVLLITFLLLPAYAFAAAGDAASVGGKAVTAISTINGKAGSGLASICGKNYTDGDVAGPCGNVGYTDVGASTDTIAGDTIMCRLATSACAGSALKGYGYTGAATGPNDFRICIYSDLGTAGAPDSSDLKLGCTSSQLTESAGTWVEGDMEASITIANATDYWVCSLVDENSLQLNYNSTGQSKYKSCTDCGTTPPANLDGTWSNLGVSYSVYISIQP